MTDSPDLSRPPVPPDYLQSDLLFQLLDCCQTQGSPHGIVSTVKHEDVPIVRIYGVTKEGHSVLVHCYNFEPHLWIRAPNRWLDVHSKTFVQELNASLDPLTHVSNTVVRIERHKRRSLMYYNPDGECDYLKVIVQLPQHIPRLRTLLSSGVMCVGAWEGLRAFPTFESNVIFPLRFMVDGNIGGCNWITVPAGQFHLFSPRTSTCQIEVCCSHEVLQSHEAVGDYLLIAPFRILSIDIECEGRKGLFPEAERDPVIQIANHCVNYGKEEDALTRTIFTLKSCGAIAGANVCSFETEEEMLVQWARFVKRIDPDFLTGYNICNFDFPYLLSRGITLKVNDSFFYWGRQLNERTVHREKKFLSRQLGNREYTELTMEGRVVMDVMAVIQRDYKLRAYSLNAVSQHFLGEQKEDVHHSIISDLQQGNDETRRRLAVYCLKDAYLPVKLLERLMVVVNNVEMARVTGVPIGWLLERGQQIKVFSMLLRKARARNFVVPTVETTGAEQRRYEGATVIEPKKGHYIEPIVTLDFASLYPSIIIAHNLCYSTLLPGHEVNNYESGMKEDTPTEHKFIRKEVFPGVLPEVLRDLLAARRQARALMKDVSQDSLEYKVLNGRQLALKVSANSVYGFTGAQVGRLPCLELSATVTSYGRRMIEETKQFVEKKYVGAEVIYGDTDSVMIRCVINADESDTNKLQQAMDFGKEAAEAVSSTFPDPIRLEFEKVYYPFLLMNKKRYAGLLWTNTVRYDKLDAKGIETVRRDSCPLVASVISGVLNRMLIQRSVESAVEFVKGTIRDLLHNRLDISQLVITKSFSKSESEYAGAQAHIALVERMRRRDPASAPNVGDRVAYVIVRAAKGAKAYERSEDPIYVLENNIPIDTQHYLEHQLGPPLLRVFEGVLQDPSVLTKGDHTRYVSVSAPNRNAGGLMKFVKFQLQCISCRSVIQEGALCDACSVMGPDIYGKIVAKRNHYEAVYSQVWTQCQQCQGSLNQEVICTSRDCPVFYLRKKVQKDVHEQQTLLDRFGVVDDW
ncbi:DNA polymerase delta catalytic subunit, putative [Trypanosoma equiperdum]|uniref:DNA polymerase n=1 Tax=Trypanosoma equiperdum TaxID=5694 RepID=A0A1G4IG90_TRYEQ|nr:DNA polymerase delta catalytic subunit, putative [Trypanosoma equiperdum]